MDLIRLSVKRPVATGVLYTFLCGAGLFIWGRLPQEVMPDLNFPQLSIVTDYAQASPEEIENLVTKPVEEAVGTVKNVRQIRSQSREGSSVVTVEFAWGTNMDFASLNVREKLDLVKARLPQDAAEPTVVKYNPFAAPVLILSLQTSDPNGGPLLTHIAKQTFANRLQKVDGVGAVEISGEEEPEIQVELDQSRLAASRISPLQFVRGLGQANFHGAAGSAKEGSYDYAVRVDASFASADDIRKAVIAVDSSARESASFRENGTTSERRERRAKRGDQRLIVVDHVGQVSEEFKEPTSFSRTDGNKTITLLIQKQASASTLQTVARVRETLESIRPLLPSDVSVSIVYDQAKVVKSGINDVLIAVFGGGLLGFITLYFFLKSWRDALVVSAILPASTLITLLIMQAMGMSLNMISLGGLALGIGMLTDAAVCVTENIHRRRFELGEDLETAVIDGTKEIVSAIVASNLTSIAVFLPLLFVLGLLGQLFRELSYAVCISQLVSIVVSMTLVPMLYFFVCRSAPAEKTEEIYFERLRAWYLSKLDVCLARPMILLPALAGVFVLSVLLLAVLPKRFLPDVDADQVVIKLQLPNGTLLAKTDETARRVENQIRSHADVAHLTTSVGSSSKSPIRLLGRNEVQILVDLKPKRSRPADRVIDDLREQITALSLQGVKAELSKGGGSLSFVQSQTAPFMVVLKSANLAKLKTAADGMTGKLSGVPGVVQPRHSFSLPAPEVRLHINKDRAARMGLTVSDIAQTVGVAYHGKVATELHRNGIEIPVRARLKESDRSSLPQLRSLLLALPNGGTIPLSDVADIEIGEGPSQIDRLDQERSAVVRADFGPGLDGAGRRELDRLSAQFKSAEVTLEVAGEKKAQRDSFLSLFFILAVSVILVYMIMAVQFESLSQPLMILLTIPLSVIGMAIGLFVTGHHVSAVAGMGLLLLGGIVVNNGIVLIDFVNSESVKGVPLPEAIREACRVRLRPILMTAATTIMGLLPLTLGLGQGAELQAPMAITVIFGLAVSTVLTLVGLPSLLLFVHQNKFGFRISESGIKKLFQKFHLPRSAGEGVS